MQNTQPAQIKACFFMKTLFESNNLLEQVITGTENEFERAQGLLKYLHA